MFVCRLLWFHINFMILFSIFEKRSKKFHWDCTEFIDCFCWHGQFYTSSHEQWGSLNILMSSSIPFLQRFNVQVA